MPVFNFDAYYRGCDVQLSRGDGREFSTDVHIRVSDTGDLEAILRIPRGLDILAPGECRIDVSWSNPTFGSENRGKNGCGGDNVFFELLD